MFQRAVFTLAFLSALPAFAAGELTVSRITGSATINQAGKPQPAALKQVLKPGDVLAAGSKSRAGLNFGTGGSFTLAGLSELQVFEASTGTGKTPALAKLKLLAGAVRVVSAPGSGKLAQDVRLNVGLLKTRVFGAEIWGASTAEGDTVCVVQGAVEVQTSATAAPERLSEAGSCLRRDPDGKLSRLTAVSDAILPAAIAATAFPPELPVAPPPPKAPPAPMVAVAPPPPPPPAPVAVAVPPAPVKPVVKILPSPPKPVPPPPPPVAAIKPAPPPPPVAAIKPLPPPAPPKPAVAIKPPPPPVPPAPAVASNGQIIIQTPVQTIVQSAPADGGKPKLKTATPVSRPELAKAPEAPKTVIKVEPPAAKPAMVAKAEPVAKPTKPAMAGKGGWTVVVLSSPNKANVEARTQALQDQGFIANLREAEVKGQRVYRLTVGEFGSRDEAAAYSERTLVKAGFKGWLSPL